MSRRYSTWTVLGVFCGIGAILDIVIATSVTIGGDISAAFFFGAIFSQIIALAVWSAWAPVGVFQRMSSCFVLAAAASFSAFASDPSNEEVLAISAAMFVLWITIQVPLLVLRLSFGWRLSWPDEAGDGGKVSETQFGIAQMLAWTALVAAALGLGRLILPTEKLDGLQRPAIALSITGLLTVFSSLLAWPIVWAVFVRQRVVGWLATAAICMIVINFAETAAFKAALGSVDTGIFWMINGAQFVTGAGILLLFRWAGFRLTNDRWAGPDSSESLPPT